MRSFDLRASACAAVLNMKLRYHPKMLPLITVLCKHLRCTPTQLRKILTIPKINEKAANFLFYNFNAYDLSNPVKKYRIYVCDPTREPDRVGKVPVFNSNKGLMFNPRYFSDYRIALKEASINVTYQTVKCIASAHFSLDCIVLELVDQYRDEAALDVFGEVIHDELAKSESSEGSEFTKEELQELTEIYRMHCDSDHWDLETLLPPEPEDDLADMFNKMNLEPQCKLDADHCGCEYEHTPKPDVEMPSCSSADLPKMSMLRMWGTNEEGEAFHAVKPV